MFDPCLVVPLAIRVGFETVAQLPGNIFGGLSPGLAAELDEHKQEGGNCPFHLLFLSLDAIARLLSPVWYEAKFAVFWSWREQNLAANSIKHLHFTHAFDIR